MTTPTRFKITNDFKPGNWRLLKGGLEFAASAIGTTIRVILFFKPGLFKPTPPRHNDPDDHPPKKSNHRHSSLHHQPSHAQLGHCHI